MTNCSAGSGVFFKALQFRLLVAIHVDAGHRRQNHPLFLVGRLLQGPVNLHWLGTRPEALQVACPQGAVRGLGSFRQVAQDIQDVKCSDL